MCYESVAPFFLTSGSLDTFPPDQWPFLQTSSSLCPLPCLSVQTLGTQLCIDGCGPLSPSWVRKCAAHMLPWDFPHSELRGLRSSPSLDAGRWEQTTHSETWLCQCGLEIPGMLAHLLLFSSLLGRNRRKEAWGVKVGKKESVVIHTHMMVYIESSKELMWNHPMLLVIEYIVHKN